MIVTLSFIFFILSLYFFIKTEHLLIRITHLFLTAIFLMVTGCYLLADYFTGNGIDEAVLYHLEYGLNGAGFGEYIALIGITIAVLAFTIWALVWAHQNARLKSNNSVLMSISAIVVVIAALLASPGSKDLYALYHYQLELFNDPFGELNIAADKSELNALPVFKQYYQTAGLKDKPTNARNLVFIYMEGFERTYFDETRFPRLIKHLRKLENSSTSFTNVNEITGSGWTIAGMVASQCGIPLFTPSHGNSMSGMDHFLSGANCLGDILKQAGYYLTFYGGADAAFAGKGKFYNTHGFDDVLGKKELLPMLPNSNYKNAWGLFDDSLLDLTFERFKELSKQKDPFGLFLLTLDTHSPNGHLSSSCNGVKYQDGSNAILNAVACSDLLISRFVKKIKKSEFADNTLIVLVSDHLALKNTAYSILTQGPRKGLFMILGSGVDSKLVDKKGSSFDIAPTLLPYLDINAKFGLGRDLLSEETPIITEFAENTNGIMLYWLPQIRKLWDFPQIHESIAVDLNGGTIYLDEREFPLPILIELNSKLHTQLRFQIDSSPEQLKLIDHLREFDSNIPFVWVDDCSVVNILIASPLDEEMCVVLGITQNTVQVMKSKSGTVMITAEEIHKLIANNN